ncbi:hypothetical protein GCM10011506_27710 [Marivirga lumbricoides]|uniref:Secretion system C-terminal sorting domain-containing protein n=1 Tax=Marivirga lumbricoides TaxID=1046115 RepID=A0ABQ1MPA0_9BACT|nr:hypothetical protein GCM10011506_27710 [Marivirga lumbricoides]
MRILFILSFLLVNSISAIAQWNFQSFEGIPVRDQDSQQKLFPWAGGLNGVQYSQVDLNNDGLKDIVAFDRSSGRKMCFLRRNNGYEYSLAYEAYLPQQISNFLIMKDYDQDGKNDIFTAGNLGITVFKNTSTGILPTWEKVIDFIPYESLSGNTVNLQVNFNDYPFIADIDGDGDLDIFNFNFSGLESKIIFYKNESIETTGTADINNYRIVNNNWGEVEDCDCGVFAFSGEECNTGLGLSLARAQARHAGGKSILIHDVDEDGSFELITSHEECKELYAFLNSQTTGTSPIYNSFTSSFPSAENPANFNFYPNSMLIDYNLDGTDELIVSPNLEANFGTPVDFVNSNWLYEVNADGYELTTKSFLQEEMIEWGALTSPAFYDYDADGDLDLFIAYTHLNEAENLYSAIAYYENTGNAENPSFQLVTDNFLNIRSIGMANMVMQWFDIDQDGAIDLSLQGTIDNSNRLFFLYNNGGSFNISERQLITDAAIGFGFSVHLADVTGSTSPDLLVGKSSGGLILYENVGSGRNPSFNQVNNQYLGISDDFFRSALNVYVDDLNNDGNKDLIASDLSGRMRIYNDVKNNEGDFDTLQLYNPLSSGFEAFDFGKRNILTTARLFNDDYPSLVMGSISGGVRVFRNIEEFPVSETADEKIFIVYPNPSASGILNITNNQNISVSVTSADGKRILNNIFVSANQPQTIDLSTLASGLYFVGARFSDGSRVVRKIIIK